MDRESAGQPKRCQNVEEKENKGKPAPLADPPFFKV
jgi:hypothetical protein